MGRGSPLSLESRRQSLRTAYCTGGLALALAVAATHAGGTLRAIDDCAGRTLPNAHKTPTMPPPARAGRTSFQHDQRVQTAQRQQPQRGDLRGDWDEPVRRAPAPIRRARSLPCYPPEPAPSAAPSSVPFGPPDFLGSADGYLEIPVGQTATLALGDCLDAVPRETRIATVVSKDAHGVHIRGLFPGQTLLKVRTPTADQVYLVRVR